MSSDTSPPMTLLIECAVIISSFRNRNAASGYQLREPPGTESILNRIDKLVNADEKIKRADVEPLQRKRKPRDPQKAHIPRAYSGNAKRLHASDFETTDGLTIPVIAP